MKSRIMLVLLMLLLSTSFTACADSKNDPTPDNISSVRSDIVSDTSIPTNSPSPTSASNVDPATTAAPIDYNPILEAYKAVLLNNAEFFSTDNNKKVSLSDFLTNKEIYGAVSTRFAALDMDGDKVPEVVLELTVDNNPEFYEVLHYADGAVYGYNIVYRGLEALKADGTFRYSNGAADNGYGKLQFQSTGYDTDILGYTESSQSNDGMTISYFIHNDPAAKESYDALSKEQDGKTDVVWHEFSPKNVEAELSANP